VSVSFVLLFSVHSDMERALSLKDRAVVSLGTLVRVVIRSWYGRSGWGLSVTISSVRVLGYCKHAGSMGPMTICCK